MSLSFNSSNKNMKIFSLILLRERGSAFFSQLTSVILALLLGLVLVGGFGAYKYFEIMAAIENGAKQGPPPESVTTTRAKAAEWPVVFRSVGSLQAVNGTLLGTQDIGRVSKILFDSGQNVDTGQTLVEFDTTVEEAELAAGLAQLELAAVTLRRERELRSSKATAQASLDTAEASYRNAVAAVEKVRAQIQRKKIVAPFAGQAGIRLVNLGEVILPGASVVSLQAHDPLYVNFSLPQSAVGHLVLDSELQIKTSSYPDLLFTGKLKTIQPDIDESTRNIRLQGVVSNPKHELRAGMFVSVELMLREKVSVIQIPISAVEYAPYGDTVYVIEANRAPQGNESVNESFNVRKQPVKLGEKRGDVVALISGLKAGDEIVSSATFKLRPGAAVVINNEVLPDESLSPNPSDT